MYHNPGDNFKVMAIVTLLFLHSNQLTQVPKGLGATHFTGYFVVYPTFLHLFQKYVELLTVRNHL